MPGRKNHKLESGLPREMSITSEYADDTFVMAESQEEPEALQEGEGGEWKSWLKTQHSEN